MGWNAYSLAFDFLMFLLNNQKSFRAEIYHDQGCKFPESPEEVRGAKKVERA